MPLHCLCSLSVWPKAENMNSCENDTTWDNMIFHKRLPSLLFFILTFSSLVYLSLHCNITICWLVAGHAGCRCDEGHRSRRGGKVRGAVRFHICGGAAVGGVVTVHTALWEIAFSCTTINSWELTARSFLNGNCYNIHHTSKLCWHIRYGYFGIW